MLTCYTLKPYENIARDFNSWGVSNVKTADTTDDQIHYK